MRPPRMCAANGTAKAWVCTRGARALTRGDDDGDDDDDDEDDDDDDDDEDNSYYDLA